MRVSTPSAQRAARAASAEDVAGSAMTAKKRISLQLPGRSRPAVYPALVNDLSLRAGRGEPTERRPVWIMRQAGRYLPEYRALRQRGGFLTLCQAPEAAGEA